MAAEFDAFDASSWEWQSSTRTIVTSYGRERARPEAITRRIRHRQRFRRLRVGMHTFEAGWLQGVLGVTLGGTGMVVRIGQADVPPLMGRRG